MYICKNVIIMNIKQTFKKCKDCGIQSDDWSIYVKSYNTLKSGEKSITYKNICYSCKWIRQRNKPCTSTKEKVKYIRDAKNKPCSDCNNSYPYYVMDFDHCRGTKEFGIANHSGKTMDQLINEISKCDLVCSNCHRIRTHNRRVNKINIV